MQPCPSSRLGTILFMAHAACSPLPGLCAEPPRSSGAGGVLNQFTVTQFAGSGQNSIQAIATDPAGNAYIAGTTGSHDLPVKNAAQAQIGESRIMRSLDRGETWAKMGNPPADVQIVVADPSLPQILFAGGLAGIYKTTDGGQTWRTVYAIRAATSGTTSLAVDPGNHLRLAASFPTGALVLSFDWGETWTASGCPACGGQLSTGPGMLLVVNFGLLISRDWGLTFTRIGPALVGLPMAAALDPSHSGWIYTATSVGVFGRLWLTTDSGATWTEKKVPRANFSNIFTLLVDPDQSNSLFAAMVDGIYKSTDSAATWTRLNVDAPPGEVAPALLSRNCGAGGGLFVITRERVIASLDSGLTWQAPQLNEVLGVTTGPGCAVYAAKRSTSDAFIAKLAPDGRQLWVTFLGGSDRDAARALTLDAQGNAYVAGTTWSADFPSTAPRTGVRSTSDTFVAKFSPGGELIYSVTLGGESYNTPSALAVDTQGSAYVVGDGTGGGFIAKLAADATLIYALHLGTQDGVNTPNAVLVDSNGQALIAGSGALPGLPPPSGKEPGYLMQLDPTGSQLTYAAYIGGTETRFGGLFGPAALAADAQGNVYLAGTTAAPDFPVTSRAYVSSLRYGSCSQSGFLLPDSAGDIYVMKLRAGNFEHVYTALLSGDCPSQPGALLVDSSGAVTISLATGSAFPLRNPFLGAPSCATGASVVSKLSADGSTLLFSTYLDACGAPGIALTPDGSLSAGVTHGDLAGVLRFTTDATPAISLDHIVNAFSGDVSGVVPGGLFSLIGSDLGAGSLDLGLKAQQDLPLQLGGTEVTFDGVPAPILQTSASRVIAVPPAGLQSFTAVQVSYKGALSNVVIMPVETAHPGLLTRGFPDQPQNTGYPDGAILNQDGTWNDARRPAAPGSVITLFVTGLGATNPTVAPGSVATSEGVRPVAPIYSSWNASGTPESAGSVPGFVSAMFQIRVTVPRAPGSGSLRRMPVSVSLSPRNTRPLPPSPNLVGVFVQ